MNEPIGAVDQDAEGRALREPVRGGKAFADGHLIGRAGVWRIAAPHIELVEDRLADGRQRHKQGRRRLNHTPDIDQGEFDDAGFDRRDTIDRCDLWQQRLGGPGDIGEDVGEAIILVVFGAGLQQ